MTDKLTPEEVIEYLNKCNDRKASVVVVWKVTEQKPYIITVGDIVDLINHQQAEIERLNNLKRFEKFICERIHTDKERNLTWDFATKEAEQEAFEEELEKLFDIAIARAEAIKEFIKKLKEKKHIAIPFDGYLVDEDDWVIYEEDIDETYKEMLSELTQKKEIITIEN